MQRLSFSNGDFGRALAAETYIGKRQKFGSDWMRDSRYSAETSAIEGSRTSRERQLNMLCRDWHAFQEIDWQRIVLKLIVQKVTKTSRGKKQTWEHSRPNGYYFGKGFPRLLIGSWRVCFRYSWILRTLLDLSNAQAPWIRIGCSLCLNPIVSLCILERVACEARLKCVNFNYKHPRCCNCVWVLGLREGWC